MGVLYSLTEPDFIGSIFPLSRVQLSSSYVTFSRTTGKVQETINNKTVIKLLTLSIIKQINSPHFYIGLFWCGLACFIFAKAFTINLGNCN